MFSAETAMKIFGFMSTENQEYLRNVSPVVNKSIFMMNIQFILKIIWISQLSFHFTVELT